MSYQKYLEWERNQASCESSNKSRSGLEPPVGIVTIPDGHSNGRSQGSLLEIRLSSVCQPHQENAP